MSNVTKPESPGYDSQIHRDKVRNRIRIRIVDVFERWRWLKAEKNLKIEVAYFLLEG